MRKILAIILAFLLGTPAYADWTGKNAAGTTITFSNSVDCTSGTCIPIAALVTAAGATLYGTAGTANANILTVQGIASMTKLLVTPDSVALPANQSVNVSQINAVTPLMGNGATGTGSPRVTISNDNTIPTGWPTAANQATEIASLATIATNSALPLPAQSTHTVNIGAVDAIGPYPATAVPYTATATGTTGATTATLAGASSVTTYICGFSIRANATAAATGNATVTGVITATLNFTQWTAPNASGLGVTEMIFSPCVPASGTNQSVAVVSAAPGTGGVVSVTAWGYKL